MQVCGRSSIFPSLCPLLHLSFSLIRFFVCGSSIHSSIRSTAACLRISLFMSPEAPLRPAFTPPLPSAFTYLKVWFFLFFFMLLFIIWGFDLTYWICLSKFLFVCSLFMFVRPSVWVWVWFWFIFCRNTFSGKLHLRLAAARCHLVLSWSLSFSPGALPLESPLLLFSR